MPEQHELIDAWRYSALSRVRLAHERVRKLDDELRSARTELKERALDARRLGLTLEQVGQAMGVSRQRVHEMTR